MDELLAKLAVDWHNASWLMALFVFMSYFAIDAMYVYYTHMVTERKFLQAANISFVMHFLLAGGVLSYTHNAFYVLPLSLGSWAGTFWFTRRSKRMDKTLPAAEHMLPGTRMRLLHLLYASNRCTDGDRLLRFVRETLGREVSPRAIDQVSEVEGLKLIWEFTLAFPDPDADIADVAARAASSRS